MTLISIFAGVLCALCLLWLKSGRSPFIWLAVFFEHAEAVRLQFLRSAVGFYLHFTQGYRGTFNEVRASVQDL
jgi:hypothetical protein